MESGKVPSRQPSQPILETAQRIGELTQPHVDSFNFMLTDGLGLAVDDLPRRELVLEAGGGEDGPAARHVIEFWLEDAMVGFPTRKGTVGTASSDTRMFPSHCRELGSSYEAPLTAKLCRRVDGGAVQSFDVRLGDLPIMVRSLRCHLVDLTPGELVAKREEPLESGGYFICNGIERVVRLLQLPRRNYPMALDRSAFGKRGPLFSTKAVSIRCVREDQTAITLTLHYLNDGNARARFSVRKQEFFVPVVLLLKALLPVVDKEVYERVLGGDRDNAGLSDAVTLLLQDFTALGLKDRPAALQYLGERFRAVMDLPRSLTNAAAGQAVLDRFVLVHLAGDNVAKFDLLVIMLRKLYAFAAGDVVEDSSDSMMNQELLLPGHLYLMVLKEKLLEFMVGIEAQVTRDVRTKKAPADLKDLPYFKKVADKQPSIGKKLYYLLATGNLVSSSGLDLQQTSGFTVVADKINYLRFLTHFRSVHRGQFFTTMKTTSVRKLLPESWGFMCPVHTPDGAPCGLLNHLSAHAGVVTHPPGHVEHLPELLASLGMAPLSASHGVVPHTHLPVLVDGRVVGSAPPATATAIAAQLRKLKVSFLPACSAETAAEITGLVSHVSKSWESVAAGDALPPTWVPASMEVALILPPSLPEGTATDADLKLSGPFAGLFLATAASRLIRPVRQVDTGLIEIIGPLEQVFMEIACTPEDAIDILGLPEDADPSAIPYTHMETSSMSMLSLAASLTPFSDLNQSPRNMYQCQMAKQTMGTPLHSYVHRADTKLYRIQHTQAPVVQNDAQRVYCMDEYPSGCNAIVAVISYTGFDMEDAMIINKSSYERGFGHGSVYKTYTIDLDPDNRKTTKLFSNDAKLATGRHGDDKGRIVSTLTDDGLPPVGLYLTQGDPMYCSVDQVTGKATIGRHKDGEPAYVDQVRLLGGEALGAPLTKVSIKLRFNRNPVVGDKFSSRHGQKGVLSMLWPQEDMPFSETGMTPDIIINPHAFPSRMTIGMLIESMAGKLGSLQGKFQNSTPFRFNDRQRVVDYFGQQLVNSGYSYYGAEPLYSGVAGTELHADIFIGVVYYQRLRHMVSDKSQVRATGPINNLTRQPVKGRKNHGGIRFGEMERDSLLSHGTAFLLRDRLLNCSDRHTAWVCRKCGSMLSTVTSADLGLAVAGKSAAVAAMEAAERRRPFCRSCDTGAGVTTVVMPYVYRYLANELAGMNIRLTMEISS